MYKLNNSKLFQVIFILMASLILLAKSESVFKMECVEDNKICSLVSKEDGSNEIKVLNLKCVGDDCKDSVIVGENNHWYLCQHSSRRTADCSSLFDDSSSSNESELDENKRALPFETLNYGRRKRFYPFLSVHHGKRSADCDCSSFVKKNLPFESMLYGKRGLPFETLNYGKRGLPFETLNYGKRAYIPIDGYIMGKREE